MGRVLEDLVRSKIWEHVILLAGILEKVREFKPMYLMVLGPVLRSGISALRG